MNAVTDFDFIVDVAELALGLAEHLAAVAADVVLRAHRLHRPHAHVHHFLLHGGVDAHLRAASVCGLPSREIFDSHIPDFIVGKSIADALAAEQRAASAAAQGRFGSSAISVSEKEDPILGRCRAGVQPDSSYDDTGRHIRSPASPPALPPRGSRRGSPPAASPGKRRARLVRNFSTSTGMPSLRRR